MQCLIFIFVFLCCILGKFLNSRFPFISVLFNSAESLSNLLKCFVSILCRSFSWLGAFLVAQW